MTRSVNVHEAKTHLSRLLDDVRAGGEITPAVPAMVLAEAWRGGSRQANLVRLLQLCEAEDLDAARARPIGELAGASGHDDEVDVAVVEGALRRHAAAVNARLRIAQVCGMWATAPGGCDETQAGSTARIRWNAPIAASRSGTSKRR